MEAFECPSCGAALSLDDDNDGLVQCPYCGKNVVTPEHLGKRQSGSGVSRVRVTQDGVEVELHDGSSATEQFISVDTTETRRVQSKGISRWITCMVVFIALSIVASIALGVIIPLLTTGAMVSVINNQIPPDSTVPDFETLFETPLAEFPMLSTDVPAFAAQVLAFGEQGTGAGRFEDTRWVGVDGNGNIYTAEYQDGRVQKFDSEGKFLLGWNVGNERVLTDLAVSRQGVVYVVYGGDILKFDGENGKSIGSVAVDSDRYIDTVEVGVDNGLLVIAGGEDILRFDADEQLVLAVEDAISSVSGDSELASRAAMDGVGNIYVLGRFNESVFVFSADGKYRNRIGSGGDAPGQFRAPSDVAVDAEGRIFVSDIFGVQVFASDGRYIETVDVDGVAFGLAFDDANNLWIASNAKRILKYEIID
jgi:uncharacterized Zn finger protein (UPF0148 family)/streptogramin lyase